MTLHKIFAACLLLAAAATPAFAQKTKTAAGSATSIKYREFIPIEPIEYFDDVEIASRENGVEKRYVKTLTKTETLKFLTNETVLVAVAEVDKEGMLNYTPARISKKNKQYIVTMDYVKFSTMDVRQQGEMSGEACVGVGVRLIANISSKADNINLGDLFAIGMAVKNRQVYGSLRLEIIGLHDPEITASMPLPSEISSGSIQSAMQSLSTIKQMLYRDNVDLVPQILGIRVVKEGLNLSELNEYVMNYHELGKKNATRPLESNTQPLPANSKQ